MLNEREKMRLTVAEYERLDYEDKFTYYQRLYYESSIAERSEMRQTLSLHGCPEVARTLYILDRIDYHGWEPPPFRIQYVDVEVYPLTPVEVEPEYQMSDADVYKVITIVVLFASAVWAGVYAGLHILEYL